MDYIVILERTSADPVIVRYVLRATVPAARRPYFADATKTSVYLGASAQDLADLRAGVFIEQTRTGNLSGLSLAQIKARLQQEQVDYQASVNADGVQSK